MISNSWPSHLFKNHLGTVYKYGESTIKSPQNGKISSSGSSRSQWDEGIMSTLIWFPNSKINRNIYPQEGSQYVWGALCQESGISGQRHMATLVSQVISRCSKLSCSDVAWQLWPSQTISLPHISHILPVISQIYKISSTEFSRKRKLWASIRVKTEYRRRRAVPIKISLILTNPGS